MNFFGGTDIGEICHLFRDWDRGPINVGHMQTTEISVGLIFISSMEVIYGGRIQELSKEIRRKEIENTSPESAKLRLPKARSPSRLRSLGSVISSPSAVCMGWSPGQQKPKRF